MEDKLHQINSQAAASASGALSKLIGKPVDIEVIKTEIKNASNLSSSVTTDDMVTAIRLPVTGDINGSALLIFSKETAFAMSDLLVGRKVGTTKKLTKLDESALKETGNIISGSYFATFADILQIRVIEHVPEFSADSFDVVVDSAITDFNKRIEDIFVTEIKFVFDSGTLEGYFFLLLLETEQFKTLIESFGIECLAVEER
ncbi:MAG: chemotaxis protein CheC [Planctomycetes bacterium]|nr:chemotaxis protein CheC [Planctomycetota bacterium]